MRRHADPHSALLKLLEHRILKRLPPTTTLGVIHVPGDGESTPEADGVDPWYVDIDTPDPDKPQRIVRPANGHGLPDLTPVIVVFIAQGHDVAVIPFVPGSHPG